jgi:hypothetical protein
VLAATRAVEATISAPSITRLDSVLSIQAASLSQVAETCAGFRSAHSQIVATRHPRSASRSRTRSSRFRFASSLAIQNCWRVAGVVAKRQPSWLCQKHPCTNMAARCFARTRSGRPGILLSCRRYLNPRACSAQRRDISGLVSLFLMPAIIRERVAWSTMSAIDLRVCA